MSPFRECQADGGKQEMTNEEIDRITIYETEIGRSMLQVIRAITMNHTNQHRREVI